MHHWNYENNATKQGSSGSIIFESVDEILKCDHSNESYWAVLSCGTVYYAVQSGLTFWVSGWIPVGCDLSNESYRAVLSCNYAYCVTIILIFFVLRFVLFCSGLNLHFYQNEVKGAPKVRTGRPDHFENEKGLLRVCALKPINPIHIII